MSEKPKEVKQEQGANSKDDPLSVFAGLGGDLNPFKEGSEEEKENQEAKDEKNINNNNNNGDNILKNIVKKKKSKDETHTFKGYWLENEVANAIDKITEGTPKGTKSELVNAIIKKYLQNEGHL